MIMRPGDEYLSSAHLIADKSRLGGCWRGQACCAAREAVRRWAGEHRAQDPRHITHRGYSQHPKREPAFRAFQYRKAGLTINPCERDSSRRVLSAYALPRGGIRQIFLPRWLYLFAEQAQLIGAAIHKVDAISAGHDRQAEEHTGAANKHLPRRLTASGGGRNQDADLV